MKINFERFFLIKKIFKILRVKCQGNKTSKIKLKNDTHVSSDRSFSLVVDDIFNGFNSFNVFDFKLK